MIPPIQTPLDSKTPIPREWVTWFTDAGKKASNMEMSGATADRPTEDNYVGRQYFDTTLGFPIWVKSINATTKAVLWVNSAGNPS